MPNHEARHCRGLSRKKNDLLDLQSASLHQLLNALSVDEIISFVERQSEYMDLAYREELWAVAFWLEGGCGDDGFLDFRHCLISLGREAFFSAVHNPDSMADWIGRADFPFMQSEGFGGVAGKVYHEKTGEDYIPVRVGPRTKRILKGEAFDYVNKKEMTQRFPRLVAKLPNGG